MRRRGLKINYDKIRYYYLMLEKCTAEVFMWVIAPFGQNT